MTRPRLSLPNLARETGGAAAAEFAVVIPVAVLLVMAALNAGFMMYATVTLHFAVESAARCRVIGSACTDASSTQTWARSHYYGPVQNPTFLSTVGTTCSQVNGSGTYRVATGLFNFNVPISASACYPLQPSA